MIKVGIIGGAGYTAGELLRILLNHPEAEVKYIHSTSNSGNKVTDVHKDLLGDIDLVFSGEMNFSGLDVIFLCMRHGKSIEFLEQNKLPSTLKVIDLSHDYRLKRDGNTFVYGLPEMNLNAIKKAQHVANPGCFATGIQLALLPLAANNLIHDEIHVNAITGSTGAGQNPTRTSHFSWRNNNLSAYKIFEHQHLGEINQSLNQLQNSYKPTLNFIPLRGNHTRGIYVTAYTNYDGSIDDAKKMYNEYYNNSPFVHIVDENPDLKQVVNTNKCLLHLIKHDNKLLIISVSDNLIKGASGQAVQNMNIMFGFNQKAGLYMKPSAF
ncbi:MAG: N-acetyl-gamma-glutamyl-phosphate reductase [Prolixibacteraceae bacterium]|jgi:N-acetyl-gamma-glutamyl-phosphate reductase|nr:N-acetyl-gamma-glutamyl-phosphate reductase [Prolixibacteraceae bacterium]